MSCLRRLMFVILISALMLLASQGGERVWAADGGELPPAQRGQPTGDGEGDESATTVSELADVQQAVVQIEAIGTFVDPEEGMLANAAGSGTGFIIDPAGIAVTNNHVVTGGALYRVYVAGEAEPRNARVLGVAECADLAVIDIQGDGFPYLDWVEGPIRVGLDVYAAGFPLGDPEYTLTRGIVAKASASGESSWASVDKVLQHDADIVPGNSGGPLVDEAGRVVGVNYRLNDAGQYFAISRDEALPLIERLRRGENIDSIGVNAEAVIVDEDLSGIWIASVESGSPADAVGLLPGDILLTMEGLDLAVDGTLATYCDILRSHSPDDVLAIEVLRLDTEEVLEGQLNGRPLEQSFSFAQSATQADDTGTPQDTGGVTYSDYQSITDEQGIITFEVPVGWADVFEESWVNDSDEVIGVQLWAVPDRDAFSEDWGIPGVVFSYSDVLTPADYAPADLVDAIDYSETCTYGGRESIPDGFYTGEYDLWQECSASGAAAMIMGLAPAEGDYLLRIEVYTAGEADFEAMDRVLDTFVITPPGTQTPADTVGQTDSFAETVDDIDTSELIYDYVLVESPALSALLPADWEDVSSTDWVDDGELITATLAAAFDIAAFDSEWSEPGVAVFTAQTDTSDQDPVELLDEEDYSETCTYEDRVEHSHTIYGVTYTGAFDIWSNCDGSESSYAVLVAKPDTEDHLVLLYFSAATDADYEAFDVLTRSFYVETATTASVATDEAGASAPASFDPDDFTTISDAEGAVTMSVPLLWSDIVNEDWLIDGENMGRALTAAPDAESFENTWETAGVFAGVSSSIAEALTPEEVLDIVDFGEDCTYDARYDYANDFFDGRYDVWLDCGGVEGSVFVTLAANPADDAGQLLLLYVYMLDEADVSAFEQILATVTLGAQERSAARPSTATVVVAALNVRAGPGTNFGRVAAVNQGTSLTVTGQSNDCAWLQIVTPDGQPGWVSGNSQYTTLEGECSDIPEGEAPAPAAASGSAPAPQSQASSSQGCYSFQNQLGAELNITFTRRGDNWNTTFKVAPKGENRQCFDPGRYTYTLDAPPPWGSTNGELTVSAGDNFAFPIYGD